MQKNKNVKRKRHKTRFTYFRIFVKFHFSPYVHMYIDLYVNSLFYFFVALLFALVRAAFICCSRQLLTI